MVSQHLNVVLQLNAHGFHCPLGLVGLLLVEFERSSALRHGVPQRDGESWQ